MSYPFTYEPSVKQKHNLKHKRLITNLWKKHKGNIKAICKETGSIKMTYYWIHEYGLWSPK
jgi:transcriptional regulator with PAS, ATPase and Fis domain